MANKPPAFQFYPKDWLTDSKRMGMTLEQRGAYIDLLCHQWINGPIPDDIILISMIVGVP